MRQHLLRAGDALDQYLDLATGVLVSPQACRNNAGIIKYQQVACIQQPGEIHKPAINKAVIVRIDAQQTTRLPLRFSQGCVAI